jgi:tetratricopeptide (TPR) repeat protein
MRRHLLAAALLLAGSVAPCAADDQMDCNDPNVHRDANIAACDRAISSGQFRGAALRDLYAGRARHLSDRRDAERAYADFASALQLDPNNTQLLSNALIAALSAGRIDEGIGLARRALSIDRNYAIAHLAVGVQAIKLGQYAAAQQDIRQAVKGPVTDLVAALLSGWASLGAGDSKSAIATIDRLNGPDSYAMFKDLHAGLILDLAGRAKDAGARFDRAFRPDDPALRVSQAYGRWLSRNGDLQGAKSVYETFDRKFPRNSLIRDELREVNAGARLPPLADTPQAGAAEVFYGIGATLTHHGGADLAQVYLQLALYLQPDHPPALFALGDLYEFVRAPQLAVDVYRRVPVTSPLWRNAQILSATDLDASGRTEEGDRILRSMTADDPRDAEAFMALGNIERGHKKFIECGLTYSHAIDAWPDARDLANLWLLRYYRGICEERSHQWDKAEADLRKALELKPDEPHVLNYLGYSLIDQGLKIDEALGMIRRAVEQQPNDGYIVDSLGWAYFRLGNLAEAEKHIKRAVELVPEDPTVRQHLGDLYWKLGLKSQARAAWTEALKYNPEPDDAADIENRIRDGLPDGSSQAPAKLATVAPAHSLAVAQGDRPVPVAKVVIPPGRRVALVIGNSGYRSVPALANPGKDSKAVAEALRQVGFQSVTLVNDATRDKMVEAIRAFATEADHSDWALIYYAGHGIEVGGSNYLIPVDAKLASDRDVQFEAIGLEQIMSAVDGAGKLRLVLLDACRDNPFANTMQRSTASRSIGRGLGQVEPDAGMLVVYAAKHGQIAFDGDGQNSPFVSAFVKRITTPQIEIRKLFDLVRDDVMTATKRQQQPFTYGSVPGSEDFYFLMSGR